MSIGDALSRIAETFGRLVVQHIQLLRAEVENEARELTRKGQALGLVIAKAAPFILAGFIVVSIAIGQLLGLLLEPWLGRAATPLSMLVLGSGEALIAGLWLKRHLPATGVGQPRARFEPPADDSTEKKIPQDSSNPVANAGDQLPPQRASISAPPAPTEERTYGAMG